MEKANQAAALAAVPDEKILEEAAARLQAQYVRENGNNLRYGTFRFIFHEGQFQGVEDWPRNKRYLSPGRNRGRTNLG